MDHPDKSVPKNVQKTVPEGLLCNLEGTLFTIKPNKPNWYIEPPKYQFFWNRHENLSPTTKSGRGKALPRMFHPGELITAKFKYQNGRNETPKWYKRGTFTYINKQKAKFGTKD